jgi:mannose-1-phosphate guanylyltransferase
VQALILAGGEGTRLRPLTSAIPKPVVPLAGRPFITYMVEWLRGHGVADVILACGFMADGVRSVLGDGSELGVRLRYIEEPEPLGTGGALKFAEELLDERFLMLNGDVLTDMDLTAQLAQHEATGARATLALIGVDDPSAYGLVRLQPRDNAVTEFLEKPDASEIDTNLINAGAYILERSVLEKLPEAGVKRSIERDVFPALVGEGLFGFPQDGYWMDIGTPDRYLQGTFDILKGAVQTALGARLTDAGGTLSGGATVDGELRGPALVGAGSVIERGAVVGGRVVLGAGVRVGAGARVESSAILDGVQIGPGATLVSAIVSPGAVIGSNCIVEADSVIGAGVEIQPGDTVAAGARIFPEVEQNKGVQ